MDGLKNSPEIIEVLFQSKDIIHQMVNAASSQGDYPDPKKINEVEYLIKKAGEAAISDESANSDAGKQENREVKDRFFRIEMCFRQDVFETGTDPLLLIEGSCGALCD